MQTLETRESCIKRWYVTDGPQLDTGEVLMIKLETRIEEQRC